MTAAEGGLVKITTCIKLPWPDRPNAATDLAAEIAGREAAKAVLALHELTGSPLLECCWRAFDEADEAFHDAKPLGMAHRMVSPADWAIECLGLRMKPGLWAALYASAVLELAIRFNTPVWQGWSDAQVEAALREIADRGMGSDAMSGPLARLIAPGGAIHAAAAKQGVELVRWSISRTSLTHGWLELTVAGDGVLTAGGAARRK